MKHLENCPLESKYWIEVAVYSHNFKSYTHSENQPVGEEPSAESDCERSKCFETIKNSEKPQAFSTEGKTFIFM